MNLLTLLTTLSALGLGCVVVGLWFDKLWLLLIGSLLSSAFAALVLIADRRKWSFTRKLKAADCDRN